MNPVYPAAAAARAVARRLGGRTSSMVVSGSNAMSVAARAEARDISVARSMVMMFVCTAMPVSATRRKIGCSWIVKILT